ncbi:uncharacterized protein BDR25DRAFT_360321 [Lindgomyces ingoldianus]|uniref:Uncharacterized protein n=1 Tax=Lindgomyces ingoldianus TaxID=673940 RepID=A0ACB6QFJ3_9PLEO|nr:uncharacterized protein BDR25DRAFT_360321 [Lindgomyces ingoldianus]KAF2465794.1 hypothetical protein BDR25DRAFT_360321 [Lindgomyces ingoldianus]
MQVIATSRPVCQAPPTSHSLFRLELPISRFLHLRLGSLKLKLRFCYDSQRTTLNLASQGWRLETARTPEIQDLLLQHLCHQSRPIAHQLEPTTLGLPERQERPCRVVSSNGGRGPSLSKMTAGAAEALETAETYEQVREPVLSPPSPILCRHVHGSCLSDSLIFVVAIYSRRGELLANLGIFVAAISWVKGICLSDRGSNGDSYLNLDVFFRDALCRNSHPEPQSAGAIVEGPSASLSILGFPFQSKHLFENFVSSLSAWGYELSLPHALARFTELIGYFSTRRLLSHSFSHSLILTCGAYLSRLCNLKFSLTQPSVNTHHSLKLYLHSSLIDIPAEICNAQTCQSLRKVPRSSPLADLESNSPNLWSRSPIVWGPTLITTDAAVTMDSAFRFSTLCLELLIVQQSLSFLIVQPPRSARVTCQIRRRKDQMHCLFQLSTWLARDVLQADSARIAWDPSCGLSLANARKHSSLALRIVRINDERHPPGCHAQRVGATAGLDALSLSLSSTITISNHDWYLHKTFITLGHAFAISRFLVITHLRLGGTSLHNWWWADVKRTTAHSHLLGNIDT